MSRKEKALNAAIQNKLTEWAARLTETASQPAEHSQHSAVSAMLAREFLRPAQEVALRVLLEDFADEMFTTYEDEFGYPWGMSQETLIGLSWDSRMSGGGYALSVDAVTLSSGERLYIHHPDDGINPFILAISASTATPRIGGLFLQQLFLSNGECFGISLIGDKPPDYVSTECVGPPPLPRRHFSGRARRPWVECLDRTTRCLRRSRLGRRLREPQATVRPSVRPREEALSSHGCGTGTDQWVHQYAVAPRGGFNACLG